MARKSKNTVDYFPHLVVHGRKMHYLKQKFQHKGYSTWFMLLEALSKAENHYLDLSDPLSIAFLASETMLTEDELIEIIEALVFLKEFDADLWNDHKVIWCDKFIDNIQEAYKKRNNSCFSRNDLCTLLSSKSSQKRSKRRKKPDLCTLKGSGNTHIKEKKRIKDNSIETPPPNPGEEIHSLEPLTEEEQAQAKTLSRIKDTYNIVLNWNEFEKLKARYQAEDLLLKDAFEALYNYAVNTPQKFKKYKSHYLVLLNWPMDKARERKMARARAEREELYLGNAIAQTSTFNQPHGD